ncbi:MAG: hypothetical protein ACRDP5_08140 [Streptosporangiaceae bacterium]
MTEFTFHVANRTPIACHRRADDATRSSQGPARQPVYGGLPTLASWPYFAAADARRSRDLRHRVADNWR